jgi:hypothetical protein
VRIIVRVAFDEGSLTGKCTREMRFPEGDFRAGYFRGDRLDETMVRVNAIKADLMDSGYNTLP